MTKASCIHDSDALIGVERRDSKASEAVANFRRVSHLFGQVDAKPIPEFFGRISEMVAFEFREMIFSQSFVRALCCCSSVVDS